MWFEDAFRRRETRRHAPQPRTDRSAVKGPGLAVTGAQAAEELRLQRGSGCREARLGGRQPQTVNE